MMTPSTPSSVTKEMRVSIENSVSLEERMKKKRGRPPTLTMPDPISDTPENVVQALLTTPPRKASEWPYLRRHEAGSQQSGPRSADASRPSRER